MSNSSIGNPSTNSVDERVEVSGLQVARSIYDLVQQDIIPGTDVDVDAFWQSFASIITNFGKQIVSFLPSGILYRHKSMIGISNVLGKHSIKQNTKLSCKKLVI